MSETYCELCGLPFAFQRDLSRYDEKCHRLDGSIAGLEGCVWAQRERDRMLASPLVRTALAARDRRIAQYEAVLGEAHAQLLQTLERIDPHWDQMRKRVQDQADKIAALLWATPPTKDEEGR